MTKKIKKLGYFDVKRQLKKLEELANSNVSIEVQLKLIKSLSHGFTIQANTIKNEWLN